MRRYLFTSGAWGIALVSCQVTSGAMDGGGVDAAADAAESGAVDAPIDGVVDAAIDPPIPTDSGHADAAPDAGGPTGSCSSDGWCWVAPTPTGNVLNAVWGASATDVWAVAHHWNGSTWSTELVGVGNAVVLPTSPNDVWAFSVDGILHRM